MSLLRSVRFAVHGVVECVCLRRTKKILGWLHSLPVLPPLTGCSSRFDVAILEAPVEANVGQKHQLSYLSHLMHQCGLHH